MRTAFDAELKELQQAILKMGSMAEKAIAEAVISLEQQDQELAEKVFALEDQVDDLDIDIENMCIRIIALQHPVASDLRAVASVLKIATDLERLSDHAENIAEITLKIGKAKLIKPLVDIPKMAEKTQAMVRDSLDAFVSKDIKKAAETCKRDDEIDQIYTELHDELIDYITKNTNPEEVEQAANLLFVARFLERIADHATNIGERVIYMVTGRQESY